MSKPPDYTDYFQSLPGGIQLHAEAKLDEPVIPDALPTKRSIKLMIRFMDHCEMHIRLTTHKLKAKEKNALFNAFMHSWKAKIILPFPRVLDLIDVEIIYGHWFKDNLTPEECVRELSSRPFHSLTHFYQYPDEDQTIPPVLK